MYYFSLIFFFQYWGRTQGLVHSRQVLYHQNTAQPYFPSPEQFPHLQVSISNMNLCLHVMMPKNVVVITVNSKIILADR